MNINKYLIIFKLLLFSCCLCEISEGEKEKLLNGFLEHYNSLPNQIYRSNEGSLQSTQQVGDSIYQIVAKIKVTEIQNADKAKALTCTATLKDDDGHVAVTQSRCQESGQDSSQETASEGQVEVAEPVVERRPVQLDNEVQSDTAITSGEQFIAIPRDQPRVPCFGCATHVNPHAAGVSDLANLGVRHLDIHQPTLKHTLDQVLDVERQVQVVNGVRYILTISVNFDNCTDTQSSNCVFSNICKITFLVKPWVKLSNGANYKAILGNNCTEEWQYGDNGEVLSESTDNRTHDKDEGNKGNDGSDIKVKHNSDVQSQPNVNVERTLTDEEIKNLEEQIIPNNQYQENYQPSFTISPDTPGVSKEHVYKVESSKRNENSIPVTEQTLNVNLDKKKAIDDLLNYFDFSGFKLETESADVKSRARRSYDYDLQLLSLTEDYHGIKSSIENARFIYGLAQTMVNYLNEIDMEVKNRAVKSVIKAEEETDSLQRYIYIQVSVIIPCDKVECEPSDSITQICNGVIDATNNVSPQILSSFCYNDNKERDYRDIVKEIPLDDPVLQNLVLEAVEKIESESKFENALKVNKIISAITQVTSGTLTKISIVVDSLKCNKKVPIALRINCTVLVQLGSKICEIIVHERHWLKEKKISYSCTERPVDMKISKEKSMTRNVNVEDPTINEMLQEAIQFLETQSENNYRQKIVNVTSISSQIIAGILTKIEFVVGYTNCTGSNELTDDTNKCHLLNGDNLRLCKAQFWDRSWIIDGRQVEVTCDDVKRKKRSVDVVEGQKNDNMNPEMKYEKLANESLNKFMQSSLNHQHYEVVKVDKVDVQHVPTELIKIQFSISPTNCILKNGILSPIGCHIINPNNVIQCRSKILENGWVDKNLVFVTCNLKDYRHHEKSSKLQERDPNDPNYSEQKSNYLEQNHKDANAMQIAVEALQAFLKNNPESLLLPVTFVDKVIKEDLTTKIVFLASHTEDDDGDTICYALLATNVPISDTEVKCHPIGLTFKSIKVTDEDPNYYKYVQLADESLYNYLRKINSSQLYTVDTIENVTVQWDEGVKTKITFIISPTDFENQEVQGKICLAEIQEQPWIHNKTIDVKCEIQRNLYRTKRQALHNENWSKNKNIVLGGLEEKDPNDPKYRTLAEESLAKFIAESGTIQPLQVVRVEKVTTQVVAGKMTRIDFVISGSQDVNKCHSEIWEQAWINKKDIKVSCGNGDQRSKRESMAGGLTEHDPNDPKYRALAEESLVKFIAESGTTQTLQVVRVEKVTTQVVAGTVTRIDFTVSALNVEALKCHSYIFEQVWLDKKEVDVDCIPINIRVRRDLGMPRGLIEQSLTKLKFNVPVGKISTTGNSIDQGLHNVRGNDEEEQNPNKPEYKLLAEESLRKFQQRTSVYHKVLEVKRVLTRVVSGLKYSIDFTAAPTACSVNESRVNARKCKTDDEIILYCHTEIWDRPWLRKKNIDVQCNDPSDDRDDFVEDDSDISDTLRPENVGNHSENHMKLAKEATEKYLTASNRKYVHKVTGIQSVNEQQSDGTHTTIDFTMSPTTCLRNVSNKDPCEVKQPIVVFNCNAKIRNKLWTTNESEIEVTCKKASAHNRIKNKRDVGIRNARQIVDDAEEMDEDIIYYYADRALQHVNDHSSSNNLHKLISIHAVQSSVQMGTLTVKMYIEIAETYCLRHQKSKDLKNCEELNGLNHRLCLARLWPSPDEELITRHISVVCDDEEDFVAITGVNVPELLRLSINELEKSPGTKFKLVHQGEPQVIPSLDSREPFKINFIIAYTNCSKDVDLETNPFQCYINTEIPSKSCQSFIWLKTDVKYIQNINVKCSSLNRLRRSTNETNMVSENEEIKSMVAAALEKLEMSSLHRYKQRVLQINSHSTKITSGKVTTIDFDVGYTSCLKYEWVENITSCDFLEHLPRRRCVAQIWERLWIKNGQNIDVNCVDDETPLESHIEFESAEMANALAREALKHIEAKYPHPSKQKVVRIFSLEKQVVAGIHYKMKIEVGFTDCFALSDQTDCKLLKDHGLNKFCRVNVWVRPWTDHPPNFRVSCDFQEGTTHDLYHHVQAEQLFYNFLTMYSPSYVNDYSQMQKRFEIFKNNIKKIHELNVHEKGTAVYGVTRFTDLTYEEFSSTYMGLNTNLTNENQVPMKNADVPDIKVPEDFDWRDHDAVTEVKDQGSCGSCWAFSVTGNIEGQWKMQSGQLVSLSEQELVDCDKLDNGCNGGLPDNAYRAIEQMGGLELESDYPYEGVGDKCEFNKSLAKVQISGAVNITKNETGMAQWLVHNGPISIGINANAMQFYMGGISHPWKMLCDPTNLDHGVLIVGYGIKDYPLFHKKLPYWIIKNSWGKSWGEQGYYRVYRGDGTCGVNQMASSAII